MVEDWLANAYGGLSRREFLARMGAAGIGLADSPSRRRPWRAGREDPGGGPRRRGENGLLRRLPGPGLQRPSRRPGQYPVVIVVPEIFGMHEHIRDVTGGWPGGAFWP
jgi:hypothetical protein